jgi:triosephosphate isomerase (TIM)
MANIREIFDFPKVLNINIVASIIIVSIREIIMINLDSFSSFFVANWKLNGDFNFIDQYFDGLKLLDDKSRCIVICPTSIHLDKVSQKKNNYYVGAQNVSQYSEGAFTGEVSCKSLTELKIDFCIVGHSERRLIYYENNADVYSKSIQLINNYIVPIICVGETLEEKENGQTNEVLTKQLNEGVPNSSNANNTIIAYEPVWAIGTGFTPSIEEINITHEFIKKHNTRFNDYKVLYGGSVKANNANDIVSLTCVDGALVGGASLKYEEFSKIIID